MAVTVFVKLLDGKRSIFLICKRRKAKSTVFPWVIL
jgi:hypothetical protein